MKQDSQQEPAEGQRQTLLSAFGRMRHLLLTTAERLLKNQADAEDVLQEAFSKLWARSAGYASEQDASAMLYTTTRNLSISTLRSRKNIVDIDTSPPPDYSTQPYDEELIRKETFDTVEAIINDSLSPMQQKILHLREYEEYSYEEIADMLDMHPSAVRMQLSRARKTIRECYNKHKHEQ